MTSLMQIRREYNILRSSLADSQQWLFYSAYIFSPGRTGSQIHILPGLQILMQKYHQTLVAYQRQAIRIVVRLLAAKFPPAELSSG